MFCNTIHCIAAFLRAEGRIQLMRLPSIYSFCKDAYKQFEHFISAITILGTADIERNVQSH